MPNEMIDEKKILEENKLVHNTEAPVYDEIHFEIFNRIEQKRLFHELKRANSYVKKKIALDIGCGTGNVTEKLLRLNYKVTGTDISIEMLKVMEKKFKKEIDSGKLTLILSDSQQFDFPPNKFGLITVYSVLHHLPNYLDSIKEMIRILDTSGILYLDHEPSTGSQQWNPSYMYKLFQKSNKYLDFAYKKSHRLDKKIPKVDYSFADYYAKKERHINWKEIIDFLEINKVSTIIIKKYLCSRTIYSNPFYWFFRNYINDTQLYIGKKESKFK